MAILHGNWVIQPQAGYFFIWGETWRRVKAAFQKEEGALPHPLAMTREELTEFLKYLQLKGNISLKALPIEALAQEKQAKKQKSAASNKKNKSNLTTAALKWQWQEISLPTYMPDKGNPYPAHSAAPVEENQPPLALYPWQVEGICLTPLETVKFLQSLPLNTVESTESWMGGELRFWSHMARWSLDLLARGKFLPTLERQPEGEGIAYARWLPLLDSATEYARLERFARQMPAACRTYQGDNSTAKALAVNLPIEPQYLLQEFLSSILDAQVRHYVRQHPGETAAFTSNKLPIREWLHALAAEKAEVKASPEAIERLETVFKKWIAPLQNQIGEKQLFRTCFILQPPTNDKNEWKLEYALQAADEPEFLVDAKTIWNNPVERLVYRGRAIAQPQETLLKGLGLASRLNPIIEPSLQQARPLSCSLTPIQAYQFIKSDAWRFQDSGLGVVLPPSLANTDRWASRLGLSIRAEIPKLKKNERIGLKSLLNFKWELTIGGQRISKEEFDRLVALNSPLVEINGEWVELRAQDVRSAQEFFSNRKQQMTLSLEDALRLATGDTQTIEKLPIVNFEAGETLQELLANLTSNQGVEIITTPKTLRGELRPYQLRGVSWLAFLARWSLGACLADDMGLGKTIQLIAFLLYLQEQDALEAPVLVVCPTSVLGNWEKEVKKFAPTLKTLVHHGEKRAKGKAFVKAVSGKHLVITSYPLVFRDLKDLQGISWQGVVLDEAQNIKNPEAKQSQAVRQLPAQFKMALTGTPLENRLTELWSIMDFLNPGYLGNKSFFQRRFVIPIEKYGDASSLSALRSLVQPFILRRLKTDKDIIQDLPEKQEMTVFCGLSAEQAELYQNIVEQSLEKIEESQGIQRRGMILALLVKLKQICNHPAHFLKKDSLEGHQSGKLQRLEEMLEELLAEGDRALIFTQFAEWGKLLQPHLENKLGREVLFLSGSTSKQKREEMVERFQNDPQGPKILILSLKAGGTGLNLTRANHVFHFDRWWNPAVENQATDRAFRIGQIRNVQVHKFVCMGTLEEKIHELIESKKFLAEQVIGEGENWLADLDTEELRNLIMLDRNAILDEDVD